MRWKTRSPHVVVAAPVRIARRCSTCSSFFELIDVHGQHRCTRLLIFKLLPHLNIFLVHSCFRFRLLLQPSRHIGDLSLDWLGILLFLSLGIKLGAQGRIVYRVGKILAAEIHESLQLVQVGCFLFIACILRLDLCIPCLARLLYSCCQSFVFILRRLELLLQLRNRLLIATVGALLGMLLFLFLMRLLCSCTNSIWCCLSTVSPHTALDAQFPSVPQVPHHLVWSCRSRICKHQA